MTAVSTTFSVVRSFIGTVCFTFVVLFVFLAYFQPTQLDALVHHAHLGVHDFVTYVVNEIKINL